MQPLPILIAWMMVGTGGPNGVVWPDVNTTRPAYALQNAESSAGPSREQAASRGSASAPPGGMTLLPGYKHGRGSGLDTKVGRIWKDGRPTITYDIGDVAGDKAKGYA